MTFDGKALGLEVVAAVKGYVDTSLGPILKRLEVLEVREALKGDPGPAGKDADLAEVRTMIDEALAAIPDPVPGKDGAPGEKGETGERGAPGDPGMKGADGKDGRDGADVAGGTIDRDGHLIITLTNGETKNFGAVVGKDGVDGQKGDPGADGKDGKDGFGFDDMDMVEAEDGVVLRFTRGTETKDFRLPIVVDRGVYKDGSAYRKGDGVTWGGSFWIAQDETSDKPDTGKGWRLAVKRGRDGRDGKDGEPKKVKI